MTKKDIRYEWNLVKFFYKGIDDPAIKKDIKTVDNQINEFVETWSNNKRYMTCGRNLYKVLSDYNSIFDGKIMKVLAYYHLQYMLNMEDANIKAELNKIDNIVTKWENKLNFLELTLGKVKPVYQEKFLKHKKLVEYKHYLERIFDTAKYDLSKDAEDVINTLKKTAYDNWVDMLSGFISKETRESLGESGKSETMSFEMLMSATKSLNNDVRDSAAKNINSILLKHKDVAEEELNSVLEYKLRIDSMRGYEDIDTSRHISDDIESDMVKVLLSNVKKNFKVSKKYYALKAKLLGVDKLKYHERNVPVGKIDKKFDFDSAREIVRNVFAKMDKEFVDIFDSFCETGRIDVYPRKGKIGGAYNIWFARNIPNFVLLNYTETLNDVTTLAHEMGHAINTTLSQKYQNALQFSYGTVTAEVASIFMEDFVLEDVLNMVSDKERFVILMEKLNDAVSSIHRQVACYFFELELHTEYRKIGYLGSDKIGAMFQKHMKAYMGDAVEQGEGSENWWIYRSHIRTYFYVYSYASGLLISKYLQSKFRKDASFIHEMKEKFLSVGSSKSPKEIFGSMGIDILSNKFWTDSLKQIDLLLEDVEILAKKLGYL